MEVVAFENVNATTNRMAQTTLRKVVGQHTLDQTLSETDKINLDIRKILDVSTVAWGVEVTLVEIGVDKNTTVVFPAPLMTTIAELGSFIAREQAVAIPRSRPPLPPRSRPASTARQPASRSPTEAPAEPPSAEDHCFAQEGNSDGSDHHHGQYRDLRRGLGRRSAGGVQPRLAAHQRCLGRPGV